MFRGAELFTPYRPQKEHHESPAPEQQLFSGEAVKTAPGGSAPASTAEQQLAECHQLLKELLAPRLTKRELQAKIVGLLIHQDVIDSIDPDDQ